MCYYFQRNLFEPCKRGLVPGGVMVAIALLIEPGKEQSTFRLHRVSCGATSRIGRSSTTVRAPMRGNTRSPNWSRVAPRLLTCESGPPR